MIEVTKVILENEMDLILAHKQSMKLAELAGLSLPSQTTFATAVSEVCRNSIGKMNASSLSLLVSSKTEKIKFIYAILNNNNPVSASSIDEGYAYARKLVQSIFSEVTEKGLHTELKFKITSAIYIDDNIIEKWKVILNTDPAVSPYEEIKRKNRQLIQLADKLRQSEQLYQSVTDSLPIMIFSMSVDGSITYANKWLSEYTGQSIEEINNSKWTNIVYPDDFNEIWSDWKKEIGQKRNSFQIEMRLREAQSGEYRWHTGTIIAMTEDSDTITSWNVFMADIHAQKLVEETLKDNVQLKAAQAELEDKVIQLNRSNQQLEQFAFITSHDLQEPLRKISFYSDFIKNKFGPSLPTEASFFFDKLVVSTDRMRLLIQDILAYSTVKKDVFTRVSLSQIASDVITDFDLSVREKKAVVNVGALPDVDGNTRQLKQLFENLVSNALKFSHSDVPPVISITSKTDDQHAYVLFSDNGIGFEDKYIVKMFDLFQRLHTKDKFGGTGIGLAICRKIVDMHSGSITASGEPGKGAEFLVTLPLNNMASE